jgi:hypothetical protein
MKFDAAYKIGVETLLPEGSAQANVEVALPITVEFEVRRAALSSSQTATFRLYQLGERTRDLIQKDWFDLSDVRAVQFRAGYEADPSSLIFNGTLKQAQSSKRPGGTDWVTTIEAFDGGAAMANGFTLRTIAGGALYSDIIKNLARDLPGLASQAFIGSVPGKTIRGASFAGNTWRYIFQMSNGLAFVDNGQLKILSPEEYAAGEIPSISAESGLLGTPERFLNMIKVMMLFEPRFTVGQLVSLNSAGAKRFNGLYKVVGLVHRGTISISSAGERRTELTLWNGLGNSSSWVPVQEASLG